MTKTLKAIPAGRGNHQVHAYVQADTPGQPLEAACGATVTHPSLLRLIPDDELRERCRVCFPPAAPATASSSLQAADVRRPGPNVYTIRWRFAPYKGPCVFLFSAEAPSRQDVIEALQFVADGRAVILED